MGSIKSHYRKAVQRWGVEHPLRIYNREAFVDIFQGVYDTACTESNATKGFEVAGLYPLDEGRVDASKCFPADLFDPRNAPAELPPVNNEPETILQQDVIPGNPDAPNGNDGLPMTIRVDGVLYVRSPTQAEQPPAPATPAPAPPAPPAPAPPMAPPQTRLEVIDEILATPRRPAPRAMRGRGGVRMQGLPRCISDHRYRAMLQEKEDAKKEAEVAKEERKRQREEAKKAKEEEKKKKKEEKERKQLGAQASAMAALGTMASTSSGGETRQGSGKRRKKRPVRFESSSESEDDSPVYDDSSSTDGEEEEEEDEDVRKWRYCAKCWEALQGFGQGNSDWLRYSVL